MALQTEFVSAGEDYSQLLDFVEEVGFGAIPQIVPADLVPEPVSPRRYDATTNERFFYLLPTELSAVEAMYVELPADPTRSRLVPRSSPVVEFGRSRQDGDRVFVARIYLGTDPNDPRFEVVRKKYQRLARHLRSWEAILDPTKIYVGPITMQAVRVGRLRIFHEFREVPLPGITQKKQHE